MEHHSSEYPLNLQKKTFWKDDIFVIQYLARDGMNHLSLRGTQYAAWVLVIILFFFSGCSCGIFF